MFCAGDDASFPLDLVVKAGLCTCRMGDVAAAATYFSRLLAEPVDQYADLYLEVANAYMAGGQAAAAVPFLDALAQQAATAATAGGGEGGGGGGGGGDDVAAGQLQIWSRLLEAHRAAGQPEQAADAVRSRLATLPVGSEAHTQLSLMLGELLESLGQHAETARLLEEVRLAAMDGWTHGWSVWR